MSNGRLMEDLPIGEAYLPLVARSDVALKGLCQRLGLGVHRPALSSCEGYTVQLQQAQEAEEEESASESASATAAEQIVEQPSESSIDQMAKQQMNAEWPTFRMMQQLDALPPDGSRPLAVLLTTGGHNPVHRGHLQMLHQAAERVESQGYRVVSMWLSPSHDSYLQPKAAHLGTIGLSSDLRLELARRTIGDTELIAVSSWEASRDGYWPDYPEVCEALQEFLAQDEQLPNGISTFYVCGTDHAEKCGLGYGLQPDQNLGVVIVPREGDVAPDEDADSLVFVAKPAPGDVAAMSSTKVRTAMTNMDLSYLEQALSPGAAQLLLTPTAKERALFAEDFEKLGLDPAVNPNEPHSLTPVFLSNSSLACNAAPYSHRCML